MVSWRNLFDILMLKLFMNYFYFVILYTLITFFNVFYVIEGHYLIKSKVPKLNYRIKY
jgi:hypothetical protein